jgi:flagellar basal body-associated protein FliL
MAARPFLHFHSVPMSTSASRARRDKLVAYTVAAVIVLLAVGFAAAWFYQQHADALRNEIVYSRPSRVVAANQDYSVAASFAVSTSGSDAGWVAANRRLLEDAVKQALIEQDARVALRPDGLPVLQERLRQAGNAALHTDKIRAVVLTDFLVSSTSD